MPQSSAPVWYRRKSTVALVVLAAILLTAGGGILRTVADPSVIFLQDEATAKWIVPDRPLELNLGRGQMIPGPFRKRFTLTQVPDEANLVVTALRTCEVRLNGRIVLKREEDLERWKKPRKVDLAAYLEPGRNELEIVVFNKLGPTALRARCDALGINTDSSWEFNYGRQTWKPPRLAATPTPVPLSREFPHVSVAFMRMLPILCVVFLLAAVWDYYRQRDKSFVVSAGTWRWALIVAWGILGINNLIKLDLDVGFDSGPHYEYIQYVAENWRIPYAGDGWQMFQAPLFYGVTAVFYTVFSWFFEPSTVAHLLRIVPLACGMAQVELCYRALRVVYPDRVDVQIVGTTFGALIPMNLYISQVLGNEPMSSLFGGLACLLLINMVCGKFIEGRKDFVLLGVVLGLALLSKATALLLLPITLAAFVYRAVRRRERFNQAAVSLIIVFGTAGIVSGWYYARNLIRFHSAFVGGWDPIIGIEWWQYPGYRMLGQYLHFGQALSFPIYAATTSFWDGFYSTFWADGYLGGAIDFPSRPPWNYSSMLSGVWLALVPIAAMATCLASIASSPFRDRSMRNEVEHTRLMAQIFSTGCIVFYIAVVLYLHTRVPHYSSAKATYTTGIIPCYAILVGGGFRLIRPQSFLWTACVGLFACWAFVSYCAFFVW
ncbi:MAG: glycosyltransferase family 39 protein [Candidatus Hydrogenedentes bacterium]|nr:glycosyltransferase family 39 protein [Candidatus Hydrogenedentota bacterium]